MRKVVQLVPHPTVQVVFAMCDDGAIFSLTPSASEWSSVPAIPQDETHTPVTEMSLKDVITFVADHDKWELILKGVIHKLMSETPNLTEGAINSAIKHHPAIDAANSDLLNVRLRD